jgi:hypothetical protein
MTIILLLIGTIIAGILVGILSVGIVELGGLIARTPDMMDRQGKRTESTNAPYKHAQYFATAFIILYLIGAATLILSTTNYQLVLGGACIFSALLFSGTIMLFEMKIYELMKKNERELQGSIVA